MYPASLAALAIASVASVALAEDVTLFLVGTPTPTRSDTGVQVASVSLIGVSPVSVGQAGATHYAYSQAISWLGRASSENAVFTTPCRLMQLELFNVQHQTTTLEGFDGVVQENEYECVHHENGTSVCEHLIIEKGAETTTTRWDVTYTGTPSPWATVKNVESALSTDDDNGGVGRTWGRASLAGGVLASFGVGVALVLA
ncbi:hypothetical protein BKA70DRAFT_1422388 [Coprinopsis sp. MPI-PUGE-AT-0042]|nr:hypothetical protein BKA70DRAFT_1422388 [Coprinopsis sp. MPI-PUGE-AT-0042]